MKSGILVVLGPVGHTSALASEAQTAPPASPRAAMKRIANQRREPDHPAVPDLHDSLDLLAPPNTPTRVRHGVLAFLCTLALLLYVDRVCIGQAAPALRASLGLSKTQMGWIF